MGNKPKSFFCWGCGVRVDVGIDPYDKTEGVP